MRHVVFDRIIDVVACLIGQKGIDFAFRNLDFFIHFTFTQALRDDLRANFFSELRESDAI